MVFSIRDRRVLMRMTQEDLAKKSGVSRATIANLERPGDHVTSTQTLEQIASALGVKVSDLFSNANG